MPSARTYTHTKIIIRRQLFGPARLHTYTQAVYETRCTNPRRTPPVIPINDGVLLLLPLYPFFLPIPSPACASSPPTHPPKNKGQQLLFAPPERREPDEKQNKTKKRKLEQKNNNKKQKKLKKKHKKSIKMHKKGHQNAKCKMQKQRRPLFFFNTWATPTTYSPTISL